MVCVICHTHTLSVQSALEVTVDTELFNHDLKPTMSYRNQIYLGIIISRRRFVIRNSEKKNTHILEHFLNILNQL